MKEDFLTSSDICRCKAGPIPSDSTYETLVLDNEKFSATAESGNMALNVPAMESHDLKELFSTDTCSDQIISAFIVSSTGYLYENSYCLLPLERKLLVDWTGV